ncbi:MAG: tyrosine-type recombinase/integrase [bacterium]|nr:tyrosine-type recombinase/integrase [bacterium]
MKNWGKVFERPGKGGTRRHWLDFGRHGKLYSHKGVPFEGREQAEALLRTVRILAQEVGKNGAIDRFAPVASPKRRVGVWLKSWLLDFEEMVKSGDRAPRTLREYSRWAKPGGHFDFWRNRSILLIGPMASKEFLRWLRLRGVQGKTAWNVVAGFHAFLAWLVEIEELERVPKLMWPKKHSPKTSVIGIETQQAILDAIPEDARGVYLAMARLCVRPSEAVVMNARQLCADGWVNVDVSRADRTIGSGEKSIKNDEAKRLPLPDDLAEWINRWVPAEDRLRRKVLFNNPRTGGPWSEAALRRQWYRACDEVGVKISLYQGTKHSTATELRRRGIALDVIQQLCGHRDQRSTEVYAKLGEEALVEAISLPRIGSARRSNRQDT